MLAQPLLAQPLLAQPLLAQPFQVMEAPSTAALPIDPA